MESMQGNRKAQPAKIEFLTSFDFKLASSTGVL
jgi:hypothetical protein